MVILQINTVKQSLVWFMVLQCLHTGGRKVHEEDEME